MLKLYNIVYSDAFLIVLVEIAVAAAVAVVVVMLMFLCFCCQLHAADLCCSGSAAVHLLPLHFHCGMLLVCTGQMVLRCGFIGAL